MEIVFIDHKIEENEFNFRVRHNHITGIHNDCGKTIWNLVSLKKIGKGHISINGDKITKDDIFMTQKRITIIENNIHFPAYLKTVEDLLNERFITYNLNVKDPQKKMEDSLKIVGLTENYLERDLVTLSSSEKKLILIARGLLSNPDTILIEEPFQYLDLKQEKRLSMLLTKLKEQFNKTIVIKSEDVDCLYNHTDNMVILKNNEVLVEGDTKEVFHRVDYLKRNGIHIPDAVRFTYLANKDKDAKIEYHSDIRDIIKDIYKHV
ncbi:MAG: ATP-binding cassette domain-containing protein [Bacilli bacterium]|nr:ATP-binding cassette domain-containing protein [Bacilli bacterium]